MTDILGYLKQLGNGWWKPVAAFFAGALGNYWVGCPENLQRLFFFAACIFVADLIFGVSLAIQKKEVDSDAARRGVSKFLAYLAAMLVALGVDCGLDLGYTAQYAFLLLVCLTEATSVLEHLSTMGVPIEPILKLLKRHQEEPQGD